MTLSIFSLPFVHLTIKRRNHFKNNARILLFQLLDNLSSEHIHTKCSTRYEVAITLPDKAFYCISEPILEIDATRILLVEAKWHFLRPIASKRQAQNFSFRVLWIWSWPVPDDVFHSS